MQFEYIGITNCLKLIPRFFDFMIVVGCKIVNDRGLIVAET